MSWKLKSYKFECATCGRTETRTAKKKPKVCKQCRKETLVRSRKHFNEVEKQARKNKNKKSEENTCYEIEINKFIKEMERLTWAENFVGEFK